MRRLLSLALLLCSFSASAQTPYLVKDINTITSASPTSSTPTGFFVSGSRIYFGAVTADGGTALWATDGTAAGTVQVAGFPQSYAPLMPSRFLALNGKVVFNANDYAHGEELWITDGTSAETRLLADIDPGPAASSPGDRIVYHGKLIFAAGNDLTGRELWISDGTGAGTRLLKDLVPGTGGSDPNGFTLLNDVVYFGAAKGLWKTDGTEGGTVLVKATDKVSDMAIVGSRLYFRDFNTMWTSDGTEAGTQSLGTFTAIYLGGLTPFGDKLIFEAVAPPFGGEFWITDGTAAGTHVIRDIEPNSSSVAQVAFTTVVGNVAYFSAFTIANGQELWKTDGTEAGTALVKDINPGSGGSGAAPLFALGGKLYFAASSTTPTNSSNGLARTLWVTDGTAAGTRQVSSGGRPVGVSVAFDGRPMVASLNGVFYFAGAGGLNGFELWRSDGTDDGTYQVANLTSDDPPSSYPRNLVAAGDWVYFEAWDGLGTSTPVTSSFFDLPRALWRSDGTAAGTLPLTDLPPPFATYFPASGHTLYFTKGNVLWSSDGTPEGTAPATAIVNRFPKPPGSFFVVGDKIFASISDASFQNSQLWATTTAPDAPAVALGVPGVFTFIDVAGRAMFAGNSMVGVSDGTPAGTTFAIVPNLGSVDATSLTVVRGQLYFVSGGNLWKSDGTAGGTTIVKKVPDGTKSLVAAGKQLFFVGAAELWVSDGTDAGTHSLGVKSLANVAAVGDRVVFSSKDSANGEELWVSDGTAEGTHFLRDLLPGAFGSFPTDFTSIAGSVYFTVLAGSSTYGSVWVTDGTAEGTKLAAAVEPGKGSGTPPAYTKAGERIFFSGTTPSAGTELWAIPLPPSPRLSINDVRVTEGDAGTATARFTVTLSPASAQSVTVDFATSDGTASAGSDYDAASGTLTFAAGETSKSVDVRVRGDADLENNETFFVTLRNAAGASLEKPLGFAVIDDDDLTADLSLSPDFVSWGDTSVVIAAANAGPVTANGIAVQTTITPVPDVPGSCLPCSKPPLQIAAGASANVADYRWYSFQQYVTATVTASQRDPQPSNNSTGFITAAHIGLDALYLTPGAQANAWIYSTSTAPSLTVTSSDPGVISVPATTTFTQFRSSKFTVRGAGVGTATIRVADGATTVGTLTVDVVAAGTKPRFPGGVKFSADAATAFDHPATVTVQVLGTAPYSGAHATGLVTVTENGRELGRTTLSGSAQPSTLPVYVSDVGANAIVVNYAGDANFLPSTATLSVAASSGSATILAAPERSGTTATIHVTVAGSPAAAPTGTISISEPGVVPSQQQTLSAGKADFTLTNLADGMHTFVLAYSGDSRYRSGSQTLRLPPPRGRAARH